MLINSFPVRRSIKLAAIVGATTLGYSATSSVAHSIGVVTRSASTAAVTITWVTNPIFNVRNNSVEKLAWQEVGSRPNAASKSILQRPSQLGRHETSSGIRGRALPPQLQIGAYVLMGIPCRDASNSTLQWWNGRFFSAGRMSNLVPHYVSPGSYVAQSRSMEDGSTSTVRIHVINARKYRIFADAVFRFCPDSTLSPTWRSSTPP